MIYGYCRVSTKTQVLDRQIRNIKREYPEAVVLCDEYSGTTLNRPEWSNLYKKLQNGDTVVFDQVSRMSRDAEEGYKLYEELYNKGVELVFLKEPHINTRTYKKALETGVPLTGTNVDFILEGINKYLLSLAREQIQLAFSQAQKEVDDLHQRTKEGMEIARLKGKQIGQVSGNRLTVKKSEPIKNLIRKYSKDFEGSNTDKEVLSILADKTVTVTDKDGKESKVSAKLARNTYYKYKAEMMSLEADLRKLDKAIESDMDEDMIP